MQRPDSGIDYEERTPKRRRTAEHFAAGALYQYSPTHENQGQDQYTNGNSFDNTHVGGHGSLWQGDFLGTQVNHYHSPQSLQDKWSTLLESLTFTRMDARRREVLTALPNTCHWLREHEHFYAWSDPTRMQEHGGFLWVKGKPGSGKSTIMKETLIWVERHWQSHTVLSYFFNARSANALEKSSLGLYRSLVHQMLAARPDYQELFITRFASKLRPDNHVEDWTEPELQNFLVELLTTPRKQPVTVFIDALDEGTTGDVRRLVSYLERLTRHSILGSAITRVCLSSRHFPNITIRKGLSLILEEQSNHRRDIEFYVESQLAYNDIATDELRQRVLDRSAGVFLWVVLVVVMLNNLYDRGKSLSAMVRKLDETPQDLHHMFADVLSRDNEDTDECVALLRWVLFSLRPLEPTEMYFAVQLSTSEAIPDDAAPPQETITRYLLNCSRGLVEQTTGDPQVMQFIHETVRDFLLDKSIPRSSDSAPNESQTVLPIFRRGHCHIMMAEECLRYLIHLAHQPPSEDYENYVLARYAAEYWWQHAQVSTSAYSTKLLALAQELLTDETSILTWVRLYDIDKFGDILDEVVTADDLAQPLYYAASTGMSELVISLLDQGADVNARSGRFGNALQAASLLGHEDVVQILLGKGAHVNVHEGEYGNALQAASTFGHGKIVQLLLDSGADVNATGGEYGNALQAASVKGSENIVQILLDRGADINAEGGIYGTALQAASRIGYAGRVQMLLDQGADVNARGGFYGCALQAASFGGHEQIMRILLNSGADINSEGGQFSNALQAASFIGLEPVVQILLNKGANVNAQGGMYDNALHMASYMGHIRIVQLLLSKGADVNARGGLYGTVSWETPYGYERIVQILLNYQGGTISGTEISGSALLAAAVKGHEQIVQILIKNGADLSIATENGRSLLHMAARDECAAVLRCLLENGADINAQDKRGRTALVYAIHNRQKKAARVLIQAGSNLTIFDSEGRTAVDWLKVFRQDNELLESVCPDSSSPPSLNIQQLRSTIASICTSILENRMQRPLNLLNKLGHCFAVLNNFQHASFALQQWTGTFSEAGFTYHNICCDLCNSNPVMAVRFVCTVCPDTDLCASCMELYDKGSNPPHCRNHEFMKFAPLSAARVSDDERREWLQGIIDEYSNDITKSAAEVL